MRRAKVLALSCLLGFGAAAHAGQTLGEKPEARSARYIGQVLDAARTAAVVGGKIDAGTLSRMGALPPELMKWGQLKNPYRDGQFLDLEASDDGTVSVVIPSIPKAVCAQALTELSMLPGMDSFQVGRWQFFVGKKWELPDLDQVCDAMFKGPSKAIAGQSTRAVNPLTD